MMHSLRSADGRLAVLAGEDAQIFSALAQGAAGAIAASAHLRTADFVRLVALLHQGALREAQALWRSLLPLVAALFAEPNPGPVKAMLAMAGGMRPDLRAPMTPPSEPLRARLRALSRP